MSRDYSYQRLGIASHLPSSTRSRRWLLILILFGLLSSATLGTTLVRLSKRRRVQRELAAKWRPWMEPQPTGYLASTSLSWEGGSRDILDRDGALRGDRETRRVGGKEGFYFFQNLYSRNGSFYAITNDVTSFGNLSHITVSQPFVVLHPAEAQRLFSADDSNPSSRVNGSELLKGGSIFYSKSGWNGTTSPYHWLIELVCSCYNVFSTFSKEFLFPRRMINGGDGWRGYYSDLNEFVLSMMIPHTYMRDTDVWEQMSASQTLFMFDEVVLFDRWAAQETSVGDEAKIWNKVFGGLYEIVPHLKDWFDPMRDLAKNHLGVVDLRKKHLPRVTYISRQITNQRNMDHADHEALVDGLQAMRGINLTIALLEELSPAEQISLALRTDIMLGVHGAGFTHMVWMQRGSFLFEIFSPDSFARDYEMITTPLGIHYTSIHNDTIFDFRVNGPFEIHIGPNFSASSIPAHAPTILGLLERTVKGGGNWS